MSDETSYFHVDLKCPADWTETQARLLAWRLADDALPREVGVVVGVVRSSDRSTTMETVETIQ